MVESKISPMVPMDDRVTVGRFTYGNPVVELWAQQDRVEIGAFCSIAAEVVILGGGEHNWEWVTTYPLRIALGDALADLDGHPRSKGVTRIGNDVWIGHGALILSGVTIGDGAVIGARSVVTNDVLPYQVVAGNPAKSIRNRFEAKQVERLLQVRWWEWPIERIADSVPYLCRAEVDAFLDFAEMSAYYLDSDQQSP